MEKILSDPCCDNGNTRSGATLHFRDIFAVRFSVHWLAILRLVVWSLIDFRTVGEDTTTSAVIIVELGQKEKCQPH